MAGVIEEIVLQVLNNGIMTESGFKAPIGDKLFAVGEKVYTMENYVFGNEKKGSCVPYTEDGDIFLELVFEDGQYYFDLCKITAQGKKTKKRMSANFTNDSRLVYDDKNFALLTPTSEGIKIITKIDDELINRTITLPCNAGVVDSIGGSDCGSFDAEMKDGVLYWWYWRHCVKSINFEPDYENIYCGFASYKFFDRLEHIDYSSSVKEALQNMRNNAFNLVQNLDFAKMLTDANAIYSGYGMSGVWGWNSAMPGQIYSITPASVNNIEPPQLDYYNVFLHGIDFENKKFYQERQVQNVIYVTFNTVSASLSGGEWSAIGGSMQQHCRYGHKTYNVIDNYDSQFSSEEYGNSSLLQSSGVSTNLSLTSSSNSDGTITNILMQSYIGGDLPTWTASTGKPELDDVQPLTFFESSNTVMKLSNKYNLRLPKLYDDTVTNLTLIDVENNLEYDLSCIVSNDNFHRYHSYQGLIVNDFDDDILLIYDSCVQKTYSYNKTKQTAIEIDNVQVCNLQFKKIKASLAKQFINLINN